MIYLNSVFNLSVIDFTFYFLLVGAVSWLGSFIVLILMDRVAYSDFVSVPLAKFYLFFRDYKIINVLVFVSIGFLFAFYFDYRDTWTAWVILLSIYVFMMLPIGAQITVVGLFLINGYGELVRSTDFEVTLGNIPLIGWVVSENPMIFSGEGMWSDGSVVLETSLVLLFFFIGAVIRGGGIRR